MKPQLLIINPGPALSKPGDYYIMLSEEFCGHVITTSGNPDIIKTRKVGDFYWHCFRFNEYHMILSRLCFVIGVLLFCLKLRMCKGTTELVVTYDPLLTGLIGWICACIFKAKFAPEVNGVHASPSAYMDEPETFYVSLKRRLYPFIESFVLRRSAGIKLLFPGQLASLKLSFKNKVVRNFPCHVSIGPFFNYQRGKENNQILFAGFPFKLKGVDILIAAFKLISVKHENWSLKILGWFPDKKELLDAISGHPRIEVHDPVYFSEMPDHICNCGIFVLPSRTEAMGRVLVEAMAAGKPRIGANVDGIPMVINDGVDGLLFEKENTVDLSKKMELLISNPDLRRKMGQAGRDRAQREFNSTVFFNSLNSFYHEILKYSPVHLQ